MTNHYLNYNPLSGSTGGSVTFAGDISGTSTSQIVVGIQGNPVNSTAPTSAQILIENNSATGSQWQTLGGDGYLGSTGLLTVTEAQAGQILFGSPSGLITLAGDSTGPGLKQPAPSTVLAPVNLTLTPQAPNGGSGSAAQNTPGSLVVALAAAGSVGTAGNEAALQVNRGSNVIATLQGYVGAATSWSGLYLGTNMSGANAPSSANFSVLSNGTATTWLNAPTSGTINFSVAGVAHHCMTGGGVQIASGTANFGSGNGVLSLANATTNPSSSASGYALLYASSDGYFNIYPSGVTSPNFRLSQSDFILQNVAVNLPIRSVSSTPYQVDSLGYDYFVLMSTSSGAKTVTLPPPEVGRTVTVKDSSGNAGSHNITVDPYLSEHIDGASSATISTNYGAARYTSDGTNWFSV